MHGCLLQWQREVWAGKQTRKLIFISGTNERSLEQDQLKCNMVGIFKQAGWVTTVGEVEGIKENIERKEDETLNALP